MSNKSPIWSHWRTQSNEALKSRLLEMLSLLQIMLLKTYVISKYFHRPVANLRRAFTRSKPSFEEF